MATNFASFSLWNPFHTSLGWSQQDLETGSNKWGLSWAKHRHGWGWGLKEFDLNNSNGGLNVSMGPKDKV